MKKIKNLVAIDISKKTLDVCVSNNVELHGHIYLQCENNKKGFKYIFSVLKKQKIALEDILFIFENTGVYGISLCYFLQQQAIKYCMIPPIEIKRSVGLTRGKSDKIDCKQIAVYGFANTHKLKLSVLPEKDIQEIKLLLAEREKVVKAISIFGSTKENEGHYPKAILTNTIKVNKRTIKYLKKQLKALDKKIEDIVKSNEVIKNQFILATSVPGVGKQTAINLIVTTRCFTLFKNWRKLACYAGLAPMPYESGTSLKGKRKISHLANKKLKTLLNMAALSAKKYDVLIKQYWERKKAEGKNGMLIMNAIRCKVLSRVFATINRNSPYVNVQKHNTI